MPVKRSDHRLALFVFLIGFLGSGSWGLGQTTAAIVGTVIDESRAVIPGVTVTATHLDTRASRSSLTDEQGRYHLSNLRVGAYEVRAELTGFTSQVRRGIDLNIGEEAVINFQLRLGEITEVVSVTAETPFINTTQATIAGVVDENKIRDLPLNARDLLALAPLYTGAAFSDSGERSTSKGYGTKLTIAGTRYNANMFLLDGTDIRDIAGSAGSSAGVLMGVETVREFNVITNAFSAEYGNHSGGVFNAVTKSGTNQFHGSVFEFHRNDNLDARNFFDRDPANPTQRSDPPEFKRNQFGATGGGRIIRDRTFFFGSYEGLRQNLGQTRRYAVPTRDARNGILPGRAPIAVHPEIKKWMDAFPLPNGRDFGSGRAEYVDSVAEKTDQDFISVRVDHRFNNLNSIFGRYVWDDATRSDPQFGHIFQDRTTNQYVTLEDIHTFSANGLNRLMLGFTRADLRTATPLRPGFTLPALTFNGSRPLGMIAVFGVSGLSSLGGNSTHPQKGLKNNYQIKDDYSYDRGSHSLKFGGEFQRHQIVLAAPDRGAGHYTFRSLPEALAGNVDTFNTLLPESEVLFHIRQSYVSFYFQDNIKMRRNLAVNLGLRYEFVTTPTEIRGHLANARDHVTPGLTVDKVIPGDPYYDNPSYLSFGPRVGIAWDPWANGKTSIRLGGGIYYDHIDPGPMTIGFYGNPPFFARAEINASRVPVPIRFPDTFFTQPQLLSTQRIVEGIQFNAEQPTVYKWALEIQREITPGLRLDAGYSATRGIHLIRMASINGDGYPMTIRDGRIFVPAGLSTLHPAVGRVRARFTDVESDYHAFTLSLNRRFANSFQLQASYTLSKVVGDFDNFTGSSDFRNPGAGGAKASVPPFMFQKLDRSLADFDVRNNFFLNSTWEIPVGRGRAADLQGLANHLLGEWTLSGILRLNSGNPFTATLGSGVFPRLRGGGLDLKPGADPNPINAQNPDRYFDPSSFSIPADVGLIGNLGRNTLIGAGVATVDLVLSKDFPIQSISEDFKVQFRSEFFNLLNRANFGFPTTDIFNPDRTVRGDVGRISETRTSSRQIQFGLKVLW